MSIVKCTMIIILVLLGACATAPPSQTDNICSIFKEKRGWYKKAAKSQKKWGSSIPTMMAIMRQESAFRAKAKPPRTRILWIFPGPRKSDAYGYPQAKNATWKWYKKKTGHRGADRDNFGDAIDFIGWYNTQTKAQNGVALSNTFQLYLAYHEGHGGFKRGTYKKKNWLMNTAKSVERRAGTYQKQLAKCEQSLQSRGFRLWPF